MLLRMIGEVKSHDIMLLQRTEMKFKYQGNPSLRMVFVTFQTEGL